MRPVIESGASLHTEPAGERRLRRWRQGGRVRTVAVGAVLSVTAAAVALGTAGPAEALNPVPFAWGQGSSGQLGNGSTASHSSAVPTTLDDVKQVSAGYRHSVAVRLSGAVWTWGDNTHGELGNGGLAASSSPVGVAALKGVVQVAAGSDYNLALLS